MFFFNCGCGTTRPQQLGETIYVLYVVVDESTDEDQMYIDLHIPFPWCHLIQRIEVVSPNFFVFGVNSLTPGGAERPRESVGGRRRLPGGAVFIAFCNNGNAMQHTLYVRPI